MVGPRESRPRRLRGRCRHRVPTSTVPSWPGSAARCTSPPTGGSDAPATCRTVQIGRCARPVPSLRTAITVPLNLASSSTATASAADARPASRRCRSPRRERPPASHGPARAPRPGAPRQPRAARPRCRWSSPPPTSAGGASGVRGGRGLRRRSRAAAAFFSAAVSTSAMAGSSTGTGAGTAPERESCRDDGLDGRRSLLLRRSRCATPLTSRGGLLLGSRLDLGDRWRLFRHRFDCRRRELDRGGASCFGDRGARRRSRAAAAFFSAAVSTSATGVTSTGTGSTTGVRNLGGDHRLGGGRPVSARGGTTTSAFTAGSAASAARPPPARRRRRHLGDAPPASAPAAHGDAQTSPPAPRQTARPPPARRRPPAPRRQAPPASGHAAHDDAQPSPPAPQQAARPPPARRQPPADDRSATASSCFGARGARRRSAFTAGSSAGGSTATGSTTAAGTSATGLLLLRGTRRTTTLRHRPLLRQAARPPPRLAPPRPPARRQGAASRPGRVAAVQPRPQARASTGTGSTAGVSTSAAGGSTRVGGSTTGGGATTGRAAEQAGRDGARAHRRVDLWWRRRRWREVDELERGLGPGRGEQRRCRGTATRDLVARGLALVVETASTDLGRRSQLGTGDQDDGEEADQEPANSPATAASTMFFGPLIGAVGTRGGSITTGFAVPEGRDERLVAAWLYCCVAVTSCDHGSLTRVRERLQLDIARRAVGSALRRRARDCARVRVDVVGEPLRGRGEIRLGADLLRAVVLERCLALRRLDRVALEPVLAR